MRVLDLFSGIGGFSHGLEQAGYQTTAFCEIDPFCRAVLKRHYPKARIYEDITSAKFKEDVQLVTAGFPCQDLSWAGSGAGITGARSGLFWYILQALRMVGRPTLLLENVAGLLFRGMDTVLGALATFGYDTEWHCIPASHCSLPHQRKRLWFIAHPQSKGLHRPVIYEGIFGRSGDLPAFSSDAIIEKWLALDTDKHGIRDDDGIPVKLHRNRIRVLGNSVVPEIPKQLGLAIKPLI